MVRAASRVPAGPISLRLAPVAAIAGLAALIAGCPSLPPKPPTVVPWPERRAQLQMLESYALQGRVAVAAGSEGFSARLHWEQQGARSSLALDGPLGQQPLERLHGLVDVPGALEERRALVLEGRMMRIALERRADERRAAFGVAMGGEQVRHRQREIERALRMGGGVAVEELESGAPLTAIQQQSCRPRAGLHGHGGIRELPVGGERGLLVAGA